MVDGKRELSHVEQLRLQGFDSCKVMEIFHELKINKTVGNRLIGNSVTVPVIASISEQIVKVLRKY
jgi:site-specific DNA-cytosine methylase